jgi:hypothetical protein
MSQKKIPNKSTVKSPKKPQSAIAGQNTGKKNSTSKKIVEQPTNLPIKPPALPVMKTATPPPVPMPPPIPKAPAEEKPLPNLKDSGKMAVSITIWARDMVTAQNLATDQFYLYGALMGNTSPAVKAFLEAQRQGGRFSYRILTDSIKGGYNVELTMTP